MCVCVCVLTHVWLCNLMDCSLPGSASMGFPRQEYWSGLPFPFPGYLPRDQSGISIVSCIADGFFWGSPAPGIVEPNRKKKTPFMIKTQPMKDMDSVYKASPVAHMVKNLPAKQETWVWSLGREDPIEKEMATHFSLFVAISSRWMLHAFYITPYRLPSMYYPLILVYLSSPMTSVFSFSPLSDPLFLLFGIIAHCLERVPWMLNL